MDSRRGPNETARDHYGDLTARLEALSERNRTESSAPIETEILELRHEQFLELSRHGAREPSLAAAAAPPVPIDPSVGLAVTHGIPEARVVRSTIEAHGSLVVRRFLTEEATARLTNVVEMAVGARRDVLAGTARDGESPWYTEFPHVRQLGARSFTETSGALVVDCPRGAFQLIETFREIGVDKLATEFLETRPILSAEKTVFRRVEPAVFASWHQDGAFLGERIRTLDVWIALSHCGRTAPSLEIVPFRVPRILPTGAFFSWDLDERVIAQTYPGFKPVLAEFAPGDAILFDQLCVHRSGHLAGMTEPRLAIECWLFGTGSVPDGYTGLVI